MCTITVTIDSASVLAVSAHVAQLRAHICLPRRPNRGCAQYILTPLCTHVEICMRVTGVLHVAVFLQSAFTMWNRNARAGKMESHHTRAELLEEIEVVRKLNKVWCHEGRGVREFVTLPAETVPGFGGGAIGPLCDRGLS